MFNDFEQETYLSCCDDWDLYGDYPWDDMEAPNPTMPCDVSGLCAGHDCPHYYECQGR